MKETLKVIAEEEYTEEKKISETHETVLNQDDNVQAERHEKNGEKQKSESGTITELLITKKKIIAEEKDDRDIVIETCQCAQSIVESWTQHNRIEGLKDKCEIEITFNDVTDYN